MSSLSLKKNVDLFEELLIAAETYGPQIEILEDIEAKITYRQLLLATYVLSRKLRRPLQDQERVGVLLPNSIGHVVVLFSLFRLGKTPAVLNFSMGGKNLLDCCETASLSIILTSRKFVEKAALEELVELLKTKQKVVYLEDIKEQISLWDKLKGFSDFLFKARSRTGKREIILFTSGSENKPKGVLLTHDNFYANIRQALAVIELFPKEEKFFNVLPMFHSFGLLAGTLLPLLSGMKLYTYPSPLHYREIPALIRKTKPTVLFGTSTFLEGYEKNARDDDFQSLRYVIAGGEKLKEAVAAKWLDRFGIRILEGYGTTETSPVLALNTPTHFKSGTVGKFLPEIWFKIEPIEGIETGGKLLVMGPNVMKGHLVYGKGFIPVGQWYDTGDVVDVDEEGYVIILSRLKRFAKIGGEMVSLNLLEQLATECFGDPGFFAVSIPGDRKGEKIILFTTRPGTDGQELRRYIISKKYNNLMIPEKIVYLEDVPVLGSGKTDYVQLTEIARNEEGIT